jgi:Glycosyl hydrolases family 25
VTLFYPDCSNNNWATTQDALNFLQQLVPQGFSGICHKVSEGNYYEDPYWPAIQQWCAANDLPLLGYHYVTTDDPASQAHTWLANNGGTEAMLDWETNSGYLTNLIAVVDAFNTAGINIQLGYYPQWYWNQQAAETSPTSPRPWSPRHTPTEPAAPGPSTPTPMPTPAPAGHLTAAPPQQHGNTPTAPTSPATPTTATPTKATT